jgi:hypothetical protein
VGCTPHFVAMRVARVNMLALRPPYWIPPADYVRYRFRNAYRTFIGNDGWQGLTIFSRILGVGPLVDCELVSLRLVLWRWTSVTPSLWDRLLSTTDKDVRAKVLRLEI